LISNHEIASLPSFSSFFLPAAKQFAAYVMFGLRTSRQAASANTRTASATTTRNARRAVVVGGMWHAGCGLLSEVVRLF
jgi:hypothetical protein